MQDARLWAVSASGRCIGRPCGAETSLRPSIGRGRGAEATVEAGTDPGAGAYADADADADAGDRSVRPGSGAAGEEPVVG